MKKIIILTVSALVLSCASVEKNKVEELQKINTQTKLKGKEFSDLKSGSESSYESNSKSENINFSISPQNGLPAAFNFSFGNKIFAGSTTGILDFSTQKAETKVKTITKTYTIEKRFRYWLNITKTQLIYRIRTKTKVITVDYPWYFWAILIPFIIIAWEILKKYLPINFLKFLKPKTS